MEADIAKLRDFEKLRKELVEINKNLQDRQEEADLRRLNVIKHQIDLEQALLTQRYDVTQSKPIDFLKIILFLFLLQGLRQKW